MAAASASARLYLCQFAQEQLNFRLKEFEAISKAMKCSLIYKESDYSNKTPFLVFSAQSEDVVHKILQRSLLVRFIYELWGHGESYDDLKTSLLQTPEYVRDFCSRKDYTFSVRVSGYNKSLSTSYQRERIEWLSFVPIDGKVHLSNPTHEFHLFEDYGDSANHAPDKPLKVYFGRLIGAGQRHLIDRYSLKTRYFIGNTSMDAQLAFIMANMAQVKPNSVVFDPFVGTGSILVSCAHFGGYVLGADIDWSLAHAKGKVSRAHAKDQWRGKDDNLRACLKQYGLETQYLDMLVADASQSVWRDDELFDAIVTDLIDYSAPYGVREGPRKVGYRKETMKARATSPDENQKHYPSMQSYSTLDVFTDLVWFAAKYLVTGGNLVYWLPAIKEEYDESLLPSHPCLRMVSSIEQPLSRGGISRYLITMCKTTPWTKQKCSPSTEKPTSSLLEDFREKYFTVSK